jgi:hypothetical protein
MYSKRHFYLYAKGHYKFLNDDNLVEHLRLIQSDYAGIEAKHIHPTQVAELLLHTTYQHLTTEYMFMEFMERIAQYRMGPWMGYSEKSITDLTIRACLNTLAFTEVKDIPGDLGESNLAIQEDLLALDKKLEIPVED